MKLKHLTLLALLAISVTSSSCSMMLTEGGYFGDLGDNDDAPGFFSPGKNFNVMNGDTGIVKPSREEIKRRAPSSERQKGRNREMVSLREELEAKESALSDLEMDRYAQDRKFLPTDSDKLYYLSLDSADRRDYVGSKRGELKDSLTPSDRFLDNRSIHSNEIYLGMNKDEVLSLWGRPARVEVAGNPSYENERWSFVEDGSLKQVYFEAGRVHGWALDL